MNYMDCKALSEIVEAHEAVFKVLSALQIEFVAMGIDTAPMRRQLAPTLTRLIWSYRSAQKRYESAFHAYLASLPPVWPERVNKADIPFSPAPVQTANVTGGNHGR